MRQRLLHRARLALQFLLVDFFHFGCGLLGFDESDACHDGLRSLENQCPYNRTHTRDGPHRACKGTRKMLSIRPASAEDVPVLNTLIHEFAKFERLPVAATEAALL